MSVRTVCGICERTDPDVKKVTFLGQTFAQRYRCSSYACPACHAEMKLFEEDFNQEFPPQALHPSNYQPPYDWAKDDENVTDGKDLKRLPSQREEHMGPRPSKKKWWQRKAR